MTKEQENDHKIITNIWHLYKNYGDITVNDEIRWTALVDLAAEMGRETPEARRLINSALMDLQDRARRKAGLT